MRKGDRIILALDVSSFEQVQRLVEELGGLVGMFKVGSQLFTSLGPKVVEFIKSQGLKVFLDLKYHDIPNTVKQACLEAAKIQVDMLTVHAIGGLTMMRAVAEAMADLKATERPKIVAVTVLTSLDDSEIARMGLGLSLPALTRSLALLAKEAGLDGVVAGGEEVALVRGLCGESFIVVTPGVRIDRGKDDQKRVLSPREAFEKGASYVVLGRAVLESPGPKALLLQILDDLGDLLR